jgi:hypothetical protein
MTYIYIYMYIYIYTCVCVCVCVCECITLYDRRTKRNARRKKNLVFCCKKSDGLKLIKHRWYLNHIVERALCLDGI